MGYPEGSTFLDIFFYCEGIIHDQSSFCLAKCSASRGRYCFNTLINYESSIWMLVIHPIYLQNIHNDLQTLNNSFKWTQQTMIIVKYVRGTY